MTNGPTATEPPRAARAGKRRALLATAALVAAALLFAAVMKAVTQRPDAGDTVGWALLAAEFIAAALVLVLHRVWWAWGFVAAAFAGFAGYTMHLLLTGAKTCGCFGAFHVPPAVTLSLDTAIVVLALWMIRIAGHRGAGGTAFATLLIPMAIAGGLYANSIPQPEDYRPSSVFEEAMRARADRQSAPADGDAADVPTGAEGAASAEPAQAAPAYDPIAMGAVESITLVPDVAAHFLQGAPEPPWMAPLRQAANGEGAEAWILFIYDPSCPVCMEFLPNMEGYMRHAAETNETTLRVAVIRKEDLVPFEIPDWAWDESPTVILLRDGRVVHTWGGEATPNPYDVRDRIAAEGDAYFGSLR